MLMLINSTHFIIKDGGHDSSYHELSCHTDSYIAKVRVARNSLVSSFHSQLYSRLQHAKKKKAGSGDWEQGQQGIHSATYIVCAQTRWPWVDGLGTKLSATKLQLCNNIILETLLHGAII